MAAWTEYAANGTVLCNAHYGANKAAITRFFAEGIERARAAESYFTMGMRGEYDKSMQADDPAAVVADVLATQRALIKQAHGREDAVPRKLRPNPPSVCRGHPWGRGARC